MFSFKLFALCAPVVFFVASSCSYSNDESEYAQAAAVSSYIVVGPAPDQPPSEECQKSESCLRQYYSRLTWNVGPKRALEILEKDGEASPELYNICHDTTHVVGEVAAQLYPELKQAMSQGDERCGSGYYHGILAREAVLAEPDELISKLSGMCSVEPPGSFWRWECFHGVGHGFVFVSGGQIRPALHLCAQIEGDVDQNPCYSGALMQELVDNADTEPYIADPYSLCKELEGVARYSCMDMHASMVWLHVSETGRFTYCLENTSYSEELSSCVKGLGRNIDAGKPLDGPKTKRFCTMAPNDELLTLCIEGAVENTFAYYGDETKALAHCPQLKDQKLSEICTSLLKARLSSY